MKKIIALFMAILITITPLTISAETGGNIDGGGGAGTGGATSSNTQWAGTRPQGYRVTIVNAATGATVKSAIDITNDTTFANAVKWHFGKVNKLSYRSDTALRMPPIKSTVTPYTALAPDNTLPKIVDGGSIEQVKAWFLSADNRKWICDRTGFDYNTLETSKQYKLLVEPLVYVKYLDDLYAVTATEASLFAEKKADFAYHLNDLVRGSLPLSMFLEYSDLGITAYTGSKTGTAAFSTIKSQLGVGIIYFGNEPQKAPPTTDLDKDNTYDFIAKSVTNNTNPIREENDCNVTAVFEYKGKGASGSDGGQCVSPIGGAYCHPEGYPEHDYGTCDVLTGNSCHYANKDHSKCSIHGNSCPCTQNSADTWWCTSLHCDRGPNGTSDPHYKLQMSTRCSGSHETLATPAPARAALAEILLDGNVVASQSFNFQPNSTQTYTVTFNVGADIGGKMVEARINWDKKSEETNPHNNAVQTYINVIPATNLTVEYQIPNASFRTGTEVISTFKIHNTKNIGALNITPKHNLDAKLRVYDPTGAIVTTGSVSGIVIPKNKSNIVYFKWEIPANYNYTSIKIRCDINGNGGVNEMDYSDNHDYGLNPVTKFTASETPDTGFDERPTSFIYPTGLETITTGKYTNSVIDNATWTMWEWDSGYKEVTYSLRLWVKQRIEPDTASPSRKKVGDKWSMKSGYGISFTNTTLLTNNEKKTPSDDAYTFPQNGNIYLPEFNYKGFPTMHRTLEMTFFDELQLPKNVNTITQKGVKDNRRVHFTPLWYKDGDYKVKPYILDCWTPQGMLSIATDVPAVTIAGNMYDDWYITHKGV